jgi:hypothetical protein
MNRIAALGCAMAVLAVTPCAQADPPAPNLMRVVPHAPAGAPVILQQPGGCTFIPAGGQPIHVANGRQYVLTLPGGTRKIYLCKDGVLTQTM